MKKILIIVPSLKTFGGVETLSKNLADLLGSFTKVYLVAISDPSKAFMFTSHKDKGVETFNLGLANKLPLFIRWIDYIIICSRLKKLKQKLKIDISISLLWRADLVNALSSGRDTAVSLLVITYQNSSANKLLNKLRFIPRFIYNRFDHILSISEELGYQFAKSFKIKKREIIKFDNFLPPIKVENTRIKEKEYLVFCGRFVDEKNLYALVQIFHEIKNINKNIQLVMIGDGPLREDLEEYLKFLNINIGNDFHDEKNDVLLLGYKKNACDFISGSKGVLIPSKAEGMPTIALMASQLEVPIVASDTLGGGMREFFGCHSPSSSKHNYVLANGGILLPVPKFNNKQVIKLWASLILEMVEDNRFRNKLKVGFKTLNKKYSYENSKNFWRKIIECDFNV